MHKTRERGGAFLKYFNENGDKNNIFFEHGQDYKTKCLSISVPVASAVKAEGLQEEFTPVDFVTEEYKENDSLKYILHIV